MPVNNFTVGKDLSFVLIGPTGRLTLNGLTDYTKKPMTSQLVHKGLSGVKKHAALPDGWEITIKLDRQDAILDNFFAGLEESYFAGVNIQNGTISETTQEVDGSVSTFQYTDVSLTFDDAGSYRGDSLIPISLTARASRRKKLS